MSISKKKKKSAKWYIWSREYHPGYILPSLEDILALYIIWLALISQPVLIFWQNCSYKISLKLHKLYSRVKEFLTLIKVLQDLNSLADQAD